jgi:hypothetical protein
MKEEIFSAVGSAAAKSAPPVTVAGALAAGITLDRLVVVLTIIYLAAQIAYLCWRWLREWRRKGRE